MSLSSKQILWYISVILTSFMFSTIVFAEFQPHIVRRLNGVREDIQNPAQFQIVTESWNRVVAVPYIAYIPEKDRIMMLISCDYPHHAMLLFSDDRGASWSTPRYVHADELDKPGDLSTMGTGLTYCGNGRMLLQMGEYHWFSTDYGLTWGDPHKIPLAPNGKTFYCWDPVFVDRDPETGKTTKLFETGYTVYFAGNSPNEYHSEAYLWCSSDSGYTWSEPVQVPRWKGFNEIAMIRAQNCDIVAACRSDKPKRFKNEIDHYEGLGVSISHDNGKTWSPVHMLYEIGRHHPSMVLLPNGDIIMTYVVRLGYVKTADGFAQFGIEAIVSSDNGQSWDLDHRYILHVWTGNLKGQNYWWPSSQATSSVLLPDGSIMTAFGTGYRIHPGIGGQGPRDVGLIHWYPGNEPVGPEREISNAPFDSDLRNIVDPAPRTAK